jgi:hypothetical protein
MKNKWIKVRFESEVINARISDDLHRRFKTICGREGKSMSDKLRNWIVLYVHEHERGNPQTILFPRQEDSLIYKMLEEDASQDDFPLSQIRRNKTIQLAQFINNNPRLNRVEAIQTFALQNGHRVETVREWYRLLESVSRMNKGGIQ